MTSSAPQGASVRDLYANSIGWDFGDYTDHPRLKQERKYLYEEFDQYITKIKADTLREAAENMAVELAFLWGGKGKRFVEADQLYKQANKIEGTNNE